ncbi:hypothetical protein M378DRAFT_920917 [Amanita muscaria Koide BX008]|uniref:Uncharacterized protein n=1 Tax=Amanita muscaria (strain Koide BX008) TaxID=946122 RepID=A0A0C2WVR7_AMAMK|nr:hypothetical protein M378DRAFT_920917 [Amanita muscaria Koide BX008]
MSMGGTRNIGLVVLVVLSALSLILITYLLIKALIRLYREHQETETLVRKVWDTEARAAAQGENEETAGAVKYSPEHMSIVPSLPPLVAHFPHVEPYRTPVPGVRPPMPAAKPSDIDVLHPTHQHKHHQPLFLRSGSEISTQQSVPAPPACSQSPPRGLEGPQAPDVPYMGDRDRRPLRPLAADELERRRGARRSKAPRTLGKENVAPGEGCVVGHHLVHISNETITSHLTNRVTRRR